MEVTSKIDKEQWVTKNLYDVDGKRIRKDEDGEVNSPWSQNQYAYTGNNPVNYVDPTGHMPWVIPLIPPALEALAWACAYVFGGMAAWKCLYFNREE